MLSPEQRAAVTAFRITAESLKNERSKATAREAIASLQGFEMINTLAADAIEQNAALAEQVRVLREALESLRNALIGFDEQLVYMANMALALALPHAAQQAAENAEKAARLDRVIEALECAQELNMLNYNEDDVSALNEAMIDAWNIAKEAANG